MNVKNITDNKKCWKTVGPNFSSKKPINENISLWEKILLITDVKTAANVFNDYFISTIKERNKFDPNHVKCFLRPQMQKYFDSVEQILLYPRFFKAEY